MGIQSQIPCYPLSAKTESISSNGELSGVLLGEAFVGTRAFKLCSNKTLQVISCGAAINFYVCCLTILGKKQFFGSKLLEGDLLHKQQMRVCFMPLQISRVCSPKKERQFNQIIFLPSIFAAAFKLSISGGLVHFWSMTFFHQQKNGPKCKAFKWMSSLFVIEVIGVKGLNSVNLFSSLK